MISGLLAVSNIHKGDVLEGGGVSSNVTLSDSSTFLALVLSLRNLVQAFMNKVGYQGGVDKVSAFYTKNLAQPWQTMFKVFNHDIPLVSVYTTGDVRVRGMLIPNAFLTEEIRATDDFKEYKTVFMKQKVVEGNKDDDDSENRLEPGSHKDNPEHVDDDDEKDDEKVDDKEGVEMGSLETRTEETQTPIPTPPRSPRTILSSDKNLTQELTETNMERKCVTTKQFWKTHKQVNQVLHLDIVSQEFNAQAPKIIEDLFKNYMQSNVIQVHPTTTTSTETNSSADLQQQLYFKMKRSIQDQANDPALWEVLKHKFEKSSTSNTSYRDDDIHSHHDDHQEDDAPPEREKRVKRHKASKISKSARGSSSKHSAKDSTTYVSKQQQQQQE
ncbi:hypothetical protein Tco_0881034 [Tanacetum coccineum]